MFSYSLIIFCSESSITLLKMSLKGTDTEFKTIIIVLIAVVFSISFIYYIIINLERFNFLMKQLLLSMDEIIILLCQLFGN